MSETASETESPVRPSPRLEGTYDHNYFGDATRTSHDEDDAAATDKDDNHDDTSEDGEVDPPHLGATLSSFFFSSRGAVAHADASDDSEGQTPAPAPPPVGESEPTNATVLAPPADDSGNVANLEFEHHDTYFDEDRFRVDAARSPIGKFLRPPGSDSAGGVDDLTPTPPPALPVQPASGMRSLWADADAAIPSTSVDDMAAALEAASRELGNELLSSGAARAGTPSDMYNRAPSFLRRHAGSKTTVEAPAAVLSSRASSSRASSTTSQISHFTIRTASAGGDTPERSATASGTTATPSADASGGEIGSVPGPAATASRVSSARSLMPLERSIPVLPEDRARSSPEAAARTTLIFAEEPMAVAARPIADNNAAAAEHPLPSMSNGVDTLRALHEQALQLVALIFSIDGAAQRIDFARSLQQLMREALLHPHVAAHAARRMLYARAMGVAVAMSQALSAGTSGGSEVDAAATEFLTHLRQLDAALDAPAAAGADAAARTTSSASEVRGYVIGSATRAVCDAVRHEAFTHSAGSRSASQTSAAVRVAERHEGHGDQVGNFAPPMRSRMRLLDDVSSAIAQNTATAGAASVGLSASSRQASVVRSLLGPAPNFDAPSGHHSAVTLQSQSPRATAMPAIGDKRLAMSSPAVGSSQPTAESAHSRGQPPQPPPSVVDPAAAARAALNAKILQAIERERAQEARGAAMMMDRLRSAARHAARNAAVSSNSSLLAASPERPIPPLPSADALRQGVLGAKARGSPGARSGSGSPRRRRKDSIRDVPWEVAAELAVRRALSSKPNARNGARSASPSHRSTHDTIWDEVTTRGSPGGGGAPRKQSTVSEDSFVIPFGAPSTSTTLGTLRVAVAGIQAMEKSTGDDTRRELAQRRREAEIGLLPGAFSQRASVDAATTAPLSASRLVSHIAGRAPALAGVQRSGSPRRPPLTRTAMQVHLEEHRRMLQLQRISASTADGGAAFTRTRNDFGHIEFQRMGRDLAVIQQAKQGRHAVDAAMASLATAPAAQSEGDSDGRGLRGRPSVLQEAWVRSQTAGGSGAAGVSRSPSGARPPTPRQRAPSRGVRAPSAAAAGLDPATRPPTARPVGVGSVAAPLRAVTPRSVSRPRAANTRGPSPARGGSAIVATRGPSAAASAAPRGPAPAAYRLDPVLAEPLNGPTFELALRAPRGTAPTTVSESVAYGGGRDKMKEGTPGPAAATRTRLGPDDTVRKLQAQLLSMAQQEAALRAKRQHALEVLMLAERQVARSRSTPASTAEGAAGILTPGAAHDPEAALLQTRTAMSQLLAKLDGVQSKLNENMAMVHDLLAQALSQ